METATETLADLEDRFWRSMVDQDTDAALGLLDERALMVSTHGSMQFDHAGYRKMAEQGTMVLKSYQLSEMKELRPNDSVAILTYRVKQTMAQRAKPGETVTQEMLDSSTWVKKGGQWKCVMHTETPVPKG
jgi:hypothetical protein